MTGNQPPEIYPSKAGTLLVVWGIDTSASREDSTLKFIECHRSSLVYDDLPQVKVLFFAL
jgi:hypothetical protein